MNEFFGVLRGRHIPVAQALIYLDIRIHGGLGAFFGERILEGALRKFIFTKGLYYSFVGCIAQRAQKRCGGKFPFLVYAYINAAVRFRLNLYPDPAGRYYLGTEVLLPLGFALG